jgi:hypothetical protein
LILVAVTLPMGIGGALKQLSSGSVRPARAAIFRAMIEGEG